jgi:arginine exporter protein ArgO
LVVVGILLPRSPESEILARAEKTGEGDVLFKGGSVAASWWWFLLTVAAAALVQWSLKEA